MRNQMSQAVAMHTIGFILGGSYKIAFQTVILSSVDGGFTVSCS